LVHCVKTTPFEKVFLRWMGLLDIATYSK